jgi:NADH-quinone oxidoreductase subunit J
MLAAAIPFYTLAFLVLFFAYNTITSANTIHCALHLAITMINLAFIFFALNSPFIGGVQLVVYAGAVMVLFVMVLMLFDLKTEVRAFSRGLFSSFLKVASSGFLAGIIIVGVLMSTDMLDVNSEAARGVVKASNSTDIALLLFNQYVFAFEVLGLLLLLVAVGAVAVSRIPGGTHAND